MCDTQAPPETISVELTNLEFINLEALLHGHPGVNPQVIRNVRDKLHAQGDALETQYGAVALDAVAERQESELANA